jgi:type IV pilus assembly protein PilC
MATYVFKAMDLTGAKATGEVEAESKQIVGEQLKARGLIVLDIADKHGSKEIHLPFLEKIKATDLTIMTRQLAEESLERVADQLEKDDALRRQIKAAMVYPSVVLSFALIVLIGLVTFIVPVFVGVFKQFGGDLPAITKVTVALSNGIKGYWWAYIAGTIGSVQLFRRWKRSERGRKQWDRFRLRIPMQIGDIVQKVALARWSRTLSALVGAGVPLLAALEITGKTAGNTVVEQAMTDVIDSVKRGGTIAEPLKNAPVFPGMVTHMVGVGEETGALDGMLSKIADFYEDQVAAAVKALTSILEPIMLVVVGGIVGFIVISMYMPLFKVYDAIK